jgi:hypothetical protein
MAVKLINFCSGRAGYQAHSKTVGDVTFGLGGGVETVEPPYI